MGDCKELLFISDESGKLQCLNPHIGTTLLTYRGIASCKKNTLALIGDECLIAADGDKRLLSVWPINNAEPVTGVRTVLPGKPNAIAASTDGAHLAVAIDSKIYVYQNNAGVLLGVLSKDYSPVTKIIFLDDSVHFVTCSTVVNVWNLATAWGNSAVSEITGSEPVYTFSDHSLPVTDVYAGPGGMKARLFTTSLDQTVKIYGLRDGSLLAVVTFDMSFTALRPNCIETKLYLGTSVGKIVEFCLDPLPRCLDHEAIAEDNQAVLEGHTKAVTCLVTSIDGHTLVSGSDDATVIVWHLPSRQQMSVFRLSGAVSGLILRPAFENAFSSGAISVPFKQLHRSSAVDDDLEINITTKENLSPITFEEIVSYDTEDDVEALKEQVQQLMKKNKELYSFAMEKILGNANAFAN